MGTYIVAIELSIELIFFIGILEWFREVLSALANLLPEWHIDISVKAFFDMIGAHIRVIVGVVAILVVWTIYSDKIVSKPGSNGTRESDDNLPMLATLWYSFLEYACHFSLFLNKVLFRQPEPQSQPRLKVSLPGIQRVLHRNFQAALVAVDMLALAIILKSLGYIGDNTRLHQGQPSGDTLLIITMVFFMVFTLAFVSAAYGRALYSKLPHKNTSVSNPEDDPKLAFYKVSLRLLEPFFIFYFVMGLFTYLIYESFDYSIGLTFGSALLVWALILKHTSDKVIEAAMAEDTKENEEGRELHNICHINKIVIWQFGKILIGIAGVLAIILLSILLFWASRSGTFGVLFVFGEIESLRYLTLVTVSLFVVIFVAISAIFFDSRPSEWLFKKMVDNAYPILLGGVGLIVAVVVPAFNRLVQCAGPVFETLSKELLEQHCPQLGDFSVAQTRAVQLIVVLIVVGIFVWLAKVVESRKPSTARACSAYVAILGLVLVTMGVLSELAVFKYF